MAASVMIRPENEHENPLVKRRRFFAGAAAAAAVTAASPATAEPFFRDKDRSRPQEIDAVVDYGIRPTNTAAENDAALIRMRDYLAAQGTKYHDIYFRPTTENQPYQYTNNRWLFGVRNYAIWAYGAYFENTSSSVASRDTRPLHNRNIFDDSGDQAGNPDTWPATYPFASAGPGGRTITLSTGSDESNFSADEWVFLCGLDRQNFNANPPNFGYFEYKKIASVTSDNSGVITFYEALDNYYSDAWEDAVYSGAPGTPTMGAARVVRIERDAYKIPIYACIRGATWLPNTTSVVSDALIVDGLDVLLVDVKAPDFVCTMSRDVSTIRCRFTTAEPDKNVRSLRCVDTIFGDENQSDAATLTNAVGVTHLTLDGCHIRGQAEIYPKNGVIRRCHLYGSVSQYGAIKTDVDTSGTQIHFLSFEDNALYKLFGTGTDDQAYLFNNNMEWTFTVDSVPPDWQATTAYSLGDRVVPTANGANDSTDHRQCWQVTTAGTSGGSEPAWPTGGGVYYGRTVTDGTVTWTYCHAEIFIDADTTGRQVIQRIDYGTIFEDPEGGAGVVTAMTHDGGSPGDWSIRGTFSQPDVGDTVTVRICQHVHDRGGNRISGNPENTLLGQTAPTKIFRYYAGVDTGMGVTQTGITASPCSDQGGATKLLRGRNVVTTVATIGDSVRLPHLLNAIGDQASQSVLVINSGANSLDVFPDYNDAILGKSANSAAALAAGAAELFIAEDTTTWVPVYGNAT